ncbi:hypothetical protein EN904_03030 [Mesorhizobium sp. M7A.F.Ca.CA.001.07.2.1]|uniref:hypothetical protein n=1 Tax=Mesorhizobium TaxID=68287 RepID=UPI000FCCBFEB|nr:MULTISPECIES: hypothetical protein [Mesorhizobium]RVB36150.1 hypothetical protein EN918_16095 [Mesorhizobium sp. M7A.F.Ca.CA.004.05.1.1]MCF6126609.1 hypothetical protein [Mesorhizobium ciceri]MCQ8817707.1 hypothetical protein [Mesorhizobium sp. SEMIA396]MCQ8871912.1 hypothetical protein [Mesorhizobium sp. LMG17149]RUX68849.1 hypothetical protein EN983_29460 [Mesorhizobium sp. M7A.F.Ca.CA.004.08.2.1]
MLMRWRTVAASGALLIVAYVSTLLMAADEGSGSLSSLAMSCDLVAAYGGIFEVPSGVEVNVTDKNRGELLERARGCVEGLLVEEASDRYRQMIDTLKGPVVSRAQQAERSFVQIELAAALANTDAAIQQRDVARRLVSKWQKAKDIIERQGAGPALTESGWPAVGEAKFRDDVPAYLKACRDAGVPVPGSFAADKRWVHREDLGSETHRYFFPSDWTDAEVWTYRDDISGGFCVALVRRKPGWPVQYVGTICADKLQKKACLFDNIVYEGSGTSRITWDDFKTRDFGELVHPKDGEDRCNVCRLGNNPFIVHPKTMLSQTIKSMYAEDVPKSQTFEFVGLGDEPEPWSNFGPIVPPDAGGCFRCHGLPQVTTNHKFCSSIIEMAANRTMPPGHWPPEPKGGPWFWPDANGCFAKEFAPLADYFPSLVKLKSVCSGKVEKICPSP